MYNLEKFNPHGFILHSYLFKVLRTVLCTAFSEGYMCVQLNVKVILK
jgi:hypothetical protein